MARDTGAKESGKEDLGLPISSSPSGHEAEVVDSDSNAVRILVGSSQEQYLISKDVLCLTSEFFQRALNGQWEESSKKCVNLHDVDEGDFSVYNDWLMSGELTLAPVYGPDESETPPAQEFDPRDLEESEKTRLWSPLFDAYLLGDYLQDVNYCNAVITEFIERLQEHGYHPSLEVLFRYWDYIPKASKFRKLLVTTRARLCELQTFRESAQDWPHDFLIEATDVWLQLHRRETVDRDPLECRHCEYHEGVHNDRGVYQFDHCGVHTIRVRHARFLATGSHSPPRIK